MSAFGRKFSPERRISIPHFCTAKSDRSPRMVDTELISRKLSRLQGYVDELKAATDISREKYRSDIRTKAFVERFLHLAIEEVIDIANHIVSFEQWREPSGYRDLLQVLSEKEVIPEKQLSRFQNMISFRNMLVHRYEHIASPAPRSSACRPNASWAPSAEPC